MTTPAATTNTTNTKADTHAMAAATTDADPFAAQRTPDNDPFSRTDSRSSSSSEEVVQEAARMAAPGATRDRRLSKEWDASKVPPSRFQKRENSIFATQGSRDGHLDKGRDRDQTFKEKLKEKGWIK
ncbi:MAG: hypothetical protein M1819_001191 [Sarea resinae]|nr:MAG: hypothetical protein M1819_001191 [Sarea resinae]